MTTAALPVPRGAIGLVALSFVVAFAPVVLEMGSVWLDDGDRAYGALVLPFCVYLAWDRREALRQAIGRGSWGGLPIVVAGVACLVLGALAQSQTVQSVALPLTLAGLVPFHFGWPVARRLAFPLAFAFLMVPIPHYLYLAIAFPLQQLAAALAARFLEGVGVVVFLEGNVLHLPHGALGVTEACSGIRSLFSLGVLSLAWGYLSFRGALPVVLLTISAIPISVIANSARVVGTGLAGRWFGQDVASGVVHDSAGWAVFVVALAGVAGTHFLLTRFFAEKEV